MVDSRMQGKAVESLVWTFPVSMLCIKELRELKRDSSRSCRGGHGISVEIYDVARVVPVLKSRRLGQ